LEHGHNNLFGGYELNGYLFLNDSITTDPDRHCEFAVVRMPAEQGQPFVQVESFTVSWMSRERLQQAIEQAISGQNDRDQFAHAIEEPRLIVKPATPKVFDFRVTNEGTVWTFTAESDAALDVACNDLELAPWQWLGQRTFAVDQRPAAELVNQLREVGWQVDNAGEVDDAVEKRAQAIHKADHPLKRQEVQAREEKPATEPAEHLADALEAFWKVIVSQYPQAKTGDLSIEHTCKLDRAAEDAVREWVANNLPSRDTEDSTANPEAKSEQQNTQALNRERTNPMSAWRPYENFVAGELDNTKPGKVTGWLQFEGMQEVVKLDLQGDFHRDIRGTVVKLRNDTPVEAAPEYMDGFTTVQTGAVGDMTAGQEPHDYGTLPYFEWYSDTNGRIVLELSHEQVQVIGTPKPWQQEEPVSREQQGENMARWMTSVVEAVGAQFGIVATTEDEHHQEPPNETKKEHPVSDPTEPVRRERLKEINAEPGSREALEGKYGQVWDTEELRKEFDVIGFMAPYVGVTRKADGVTGSLEFQHEPRYYFRFEPHIETQTNTPAEQKASTTTQNPEHHQQQNQNQTKDEQPMATQHQKNYTALKTLLGDTDHIRIVNKPYMPLSVEWVDNDLMSVAHVGEQNGDTMRDPQVIFKISGKEAQPVYCRNDYVGVEHATIPDDRFGNVQVQPGRQKSLDAFVSTWMNNLREQGFFEKAEQLHAERAEQEAQRALPPTVNFRGFDCELEFQQYPNGRTALVLVHGSEREPATVATVNVPEAHLGPDEVLIKNYSENEGLLEALEKAGVVKTTERAVASGFVTVPVCKLLITPEQVNEAQHSESKEQQEKQQERPDNGYHKTLMEVLRDEVGIEIEVPGRPTVTVEWFDKDLVSVTSYAKHPTSGELIAAPEIIFQLHENEAKPVYEHHELTGRHYSTIPDRFEGVPVLPEDELRVKIVAAVLMSDIREHGYLDRAKEMHEQQHAEINKTAQKSEQVNESTEHAADQAAIPTNERTEDMAETKNDREQNGRKQPVATLSLGGGIHAAVWSNKNENGEYFTVSIERRYSVKTNDGVEWKKSHSFREQDLPALQQILRNCQDEIRYAREQTNNEVQAEEQKHTNKITR
jgi:hypothetical protein